MDKLNLRLRNTSTVGIFHDSRSDSKLFIKVFNALHDKVNDLIQENREFRAEINNLKTNK